MSVNASTTVSTVPAAACPRSSSRSSSPGRAVAGLVSWLTLDFLQFLLDGGQFFRAALYPRSGEPLAGRYQPVDRGEAEDDRHRDAGVVEVREGDRGGLRQ